MKQTIAISILFYFLSPLNIKGQTLEKTIQTFNSLKNISYTATFKQKEFFSDKVLYDTIKAKIAIYSDKSNAYKVRGTKDEKIFDGNKLFVLNLSDSTYNLSNTLESSVYSYKSPLSFLITELENDVQKNKPVVKLPDSSFNHKLYHHFKIIKLDSIENNKQVFRIISLLIDSKTHLPFYYRNDSQGFIDGTTTFIDFFSESKFSNYRINNKQFPDLSTAQIPKYFTLEKPAKFLPPLNVGTKAPNLDLFYSDNNIFNLEKEKGKIVLLNFTTNGCPHCVESVETLNNLYQKYKNSDFIIVSVNPFDDKESIQKFNRRYNVQYPEFISHIKTNKNVENYHVNAYPTFYLIDKEGNIAKSFIGYYPALEKDLISSIDDLNGL